MANLRDILTPTSYLYSAQQKETLNPKEKTIYQALTNDELIMQDMSKRDKKKYMKQKNLK